MINRKIARLRRCKRFRFRLRLINILRLVVYKTSKHIYSQIIFYSNYKSLVIVSSSTLQFKKNIFLGKSNMEISSFIGKDIASKAILRGIRKVVFDRSGFKYHGRIKNLADSARKMGLLF